MTKAATVIDDAYEGQRVLLRRGTGRAATAVAVEGVYRSACRIRLRG